MWEDATAIRVLYRAADLVADLILLHGIRPRYLDVEAERKWFKHRWRSRGGLIVRVLGEWPYESFLKDVEAKMIVRKGRVDA